MGSFEKHLPKIYFVYNYFRLTDVVQSEGRLYLVFEFVEKDLKKYFEACDGPLSPQLIKVLRLLLLFY